MATKSPSSPSMHRNSGRVILKHIQITGFCLPDWGYRGQSAFWSDGPRGRPQEDLHRNLFVIKITLLLYFVRVLFSGIKTNTFLFVFARFLTGLSVGESSLLSSQQLTCSCLPGIGEESTSVLTALGT